jgi:hypothetical protein
MANFVSLETPSGDRFYINLERIIYIKQLPTGRSRIFFSGDASLDIEQPPDAIVSKMK